MRPFGAMKTSEFGIVFEVNSGSGGPLQEGLPDFCARRDLIFKLLEAAADGKPNENNLAAARANLMYGSGDILKSLRDRLVHFGEKNILRNVSRRWWGREERNPDLLDPFR